MSATVRPRGVLRRTLGTREWALAALGVVVAMIACALLGLWQFHRYEAKSERKALVESNYSAPAVALGDVLPAPSTDLATEDQWRTVSIRGEYCTDPECVLYVRNRPLGGQVGFLQLVPFRTDAGTLLVVRGWVTGQETASAPQSPPPPPSGQETLVVRMHPDEPVLTDRTNPPGQIQSIAPQEVQGIVPGLDRVYTGGYGELVSETPSGDSTGLRSLEKPDTGLGPHLSYAFQWWALGLFFPVAWVVRGRRAVLDATAELAESGADPDGHPDNTVTSDTGQARVTGGTSDGDVDPTATAPGGAGPVRASDLARRRAAARRRPPISASRSARRDGRDEDEEDALLDVPGPSGRVP